MRFNSKELILLRSIIVLASLLACSTPASAASWDLSPPNWLTELSSRIDQNGEALADRQVDQKREIACVALAVYYESRSEPVRGQKAVAAVVVNRSRSGRFPTTPCGVVSQPSQFSFIRRIMNPQGEQWDRAIEIAQAAIAATVGEVPHLNFNRGHRGGGLRIAHHVFW